MTRRLRRGLHLEAAAAVGGPQGTGNGERRTGARTSPPVPRSLTPVPSVVDGIASLVETNLVTREIGAEGDATGASRFRMLETIREFAAERLAASDEAIAVRDAHAAWMLALTEEASSRIAPRLKTPEATVWLRRLTAEHDNLRAALSWLEATGRWDDLLRLATAAVHFWELRLHPREGADWLERSLKPTRTADAPLDLRARATSGLGMLLLRLGDYASAEANLEQARMTCLRLGDGDGAAFAQRMLAASAEFQGKEELAAARQAAALDLYRAAGDPIGISAALDDLADGAFRRGDYDEAWRLAEESVTSARAGGSQARLVCALATEGEAATARRDLDLAVAALREGLSLAREMGFDFAILDALAGLAAVAAAAGSAEQAARLLGAASALADARGLTTMPHHALFRQTRTAVQTALGEAAYAAAYATGRALSLDEAIAEGLAVAAGEEAGASAGARLGPPLAPADPHGLTPREREVLRLLAAGHSNREISRRPVHQPQDGQGPHRPHLRQARAGLPRRRGRVCPSAWTRLSRSTEARRPTPMLRPLPVVPSPFPGDVGRRPQRTSASRRSRRPPRRINLGPMRTGLEQRQSEPARPRPGRPGGDGAVDPDCFEAPRARPRRPHPTRRRARPAVGGGRWPWPPSASPARRPWGCAAARPLGGAATHAGLPARLGGDQRRRAGLADALRPGDRPFVDCCADAELGRRRLRSRQRRLRRPDGPAPDHDRPPDPTPSDTPADAPTTRPRRRRPDKVRGPTAPAGPDNTPAEGAGPTRPRPPTPRADAPRPACTRPRAPPTPRLHMHEARMHQQQCARHGACPGAVRPKLQSLRECTCNLDLDGCLSSDPSPTSAARAPCRLRHAARVIPAIKQTAGRPHPARVLRLASPRPSPKSMTHSLHGGCSGIEGTRLTRGVRAFPGGAGVPAARGG